MYNSIGARPVRDRGRDRRGRGGDEADQDSRGLRRPGGLLTAGCGCSGGAALAVQWTARKWECETCGGASRPPTFAQIGGAVARVEDGPVA